MSIPHSSNHIEPPEGYEPEYLVTLDELYHAGWAARKRYRMLLLEQAIRYFWPKGHPTRLIHLTGTNGKGSVAHYLCQGLAFAGPTGSWTSPHVFDYAERIHLSGAQATHQEITTVYREILKPYQDQLLMRLGGQGLSFAEQGILLALHLFERHGATWGVIEVGAGGRYTPQMALTVDASALTNVGKDHPKSLGAHTWQRSLEKAGIARKDVPFFTSAQGESLGYVVKAAEAEGASCHVLSDAMCGQIAQLTGHSKAPHQIRNMGLASMVIRHFYPGRTLESMLPRMQAHLPARFWQVAPNVIADVAHNPDKVAALSRQLQKNYPQRPCHFLLGLTRQRDPVEVFAPLKELAASVTLTNASYAGRDLDELKAHLSQHFPEVQIQPNPQQAFQALHHKLKQEELLVLTGSAYMIDQALNPNGYLKTLNANFGWRNRNSQASPAGQACPPSPSSF